MNMTTQKKTLGELGLPAYYCSDLSCHHPHLTDGAIAEIQALVESAIPSRRYTTLIHTVTAPDGDEPEPSDYLNTGYNQAITDITTALVEHGLMKGEEE